MPKPSPYIRAPMLPPPHNRPHKLLPQGKTDARRSSGAVAFLPREEASPRSMRTRNGERHKGGSWRPRLCLAISLRLVFSVHGRSPHPHLALRCRHSAEGPFFATVRDVTPGLSFPHCKMGVVGSDLTGWLETSNEIVGVRHRVWGSRCPTDERGQDTRRFPLFWMIGPPSDLAWEVSQRPLELALNPFSDSEPPSSPPSCDNKGTVPRV